MGRSVAIKVSIVEDDPKAREILVDWINRAEGFKCVSNHGSGEDALPVWADHGARFVYGIPGNKWRGFKVADDTPGPPFDPTAGERLPSTDAARAVRDYVTFRFPGLKNAPLLQTHVCQYESTPDRHFLIDRHPGARNVWLLGGGSGHGFKFGPALGEMVADLVLGDGEADALFRLNRFAR